MTPIGSLIVRYLRVSWRLNVAVPVGERKRDGGNNAGHEISLSTLHGCRLGSLNSGVDLTLTVFQRPYRLLRPVLWLIAGLCYQLRSLGSDRDADGNLGPRRDKVGLSESREGQG